MKKILYLTLTLTLSVIVPCYADDNSNPNPNLEYNAAVVVDKDIDGLDAFVDIPQRVAGFVHTALGAVVFAGVAPIAALTTTIPPHTAIAKIMDYLVLQPARYTFDRPVGNFNFDPRDPKKED